ncbi:uncharacterized protein MELLADRAFT_84463 [Melampsora larici-populina 98AG31]|uniref:Uncharacterized protein n=1 Tax=Melampsora larici-populina (strain 98AG31 / pathotype 3-4-7) TaxID=747676 RepID=F4SC30_MELLP|nr:uncharacterized protein MELLADRAFT_84463 [Melampsora larici-populina 98AG31]EGF97779.1 hypothetical protein MELLADRAFT_84463 [Melampsora larici-populina 98AG31]
MPSTNAAHRIWIDNSSSSERRLKHLVLRITSSIFMSHTIHNRAWSCFSLVGSLSVKILSAHFADCLHSRPIWLNSSCAWVISRPFVFL